MPASMLKAKKIKQERPLQTMKRKNCKLQNVKQLPPPRTWKSLLKRKDGSHVKGIENMSTQWQNALGTVN